MISATCLVDIIESCGLTTLYDICYYVDHDVNTRNLKNPTVSSKYFVLMFTKLCWILAS